MTAEEYAALQAAITAAVAQHTLALSSFALVPGFGRSDWIPLLRVLYPQIEASREESARLARRFYDSQRELNRPDLPRVERPLEGTSFETFVRSMEPVRKKVLAATSQVERKPDQDLSASKNVVERLLNPKVQDRTAPTFMALQTIREVENAGRRQIINAVEQDVEQDKKDEPERAEPDREPAQVSNLVKGWARVATGRETCGWCLALISRGPVYASAESAGLDLDPSAALESFHAGEDVGEYMNQWHTGCDCKVVPVFRLGNWPGSKEADRALELWNEASREATRQQERDPDRVHLTGKRKGEQFTHNELAILELTNRLRRGEIDPREYSALAG